MKAAFLYAFNVLRNISLVIVLFLIFSIYVLSEDSTFQQRLSNRISQLEKPEKSEDVVTSSTMAIKSTPTSSIMSIASASEEQAEAYQKLFRRLPIKTIEAGNKTDRFLLPKDILRLTKDTLYLTSGQSFLYSDKITEVGQKLNEVEGFFVTRQDIINCFHAEKLTHRPNTYGGYSSKHYLQIEDGYELQIPERKVPLLKNIMKQISL